MYQGQGGEGGDLKDVKFPFPLPVKGLASKDGHFISTKPKQRFFVMRIEDNWHPSLYYYEPKPDSSERHIQDCKGCVNLLRATVTKGSGDTSLVINLDSIVAMIEPNKYKGFAQLIMHFDSPSDLRRWSDAFSWILPDPQAKVAKLVAEEQAKKQVAELEALRLKQAEEAASSERLRVEAVAAVGTVVEQVVARAEEMIARNEQDRLRAAAVADAERVRAAMQAAEAARLMRQEEERKPASNAAAPLPPAPQSSKSEPSKPLATVLAPSGPEERTAAQAVVAPVEQVKPKPLPSSPTAAVDPEQAAAAKAFVNAGGAVLKYMRAKLIEGKWHQPHSKNVKVEGSSVKWDKRSFTLTDVKMGASMLLNTNNPGQDLSCNFHCFLSGVSSGEDQLDLQAPSKELAEKWVMGIKACIGKL